MPWDANHQKVANQEKRRANTKHNIKKQTSEPLSKKGQAQFYEFVPPGFSLVPVGGRFTAGGRAFFGIPGGAKGPAEAAESIERLFKMLHIRRWSSNWPGIGRHWRGTYTYVRTFLFEKKKKQAPTAQI
jgi:hypothetical protein